MKWEYDLETLREICAEDAPLTGDVIEALRAIAEQLDRVGFLLEQRIIQDELKGTAQEEETGALRTKRAWNAAGLKPPED